MKKVLTIAVVAALGIGAPSPALASQDTPEYREYVSLNRANRSGIARSQWCQNNQRQLEILVAVQTKGRYFYWEDKHDKGRKHGETIAMHRRNSDLCVSKGYMSRPQTAPVAQHRGEKQNFGRVGAHNKCKHLPSSAAYQACYNQYMATVQASPYGQVFNRAWNEIDNSPEMKRHGLTMQMILSQ